MRIGINALFYIPGEVGGSETYLCETLDALLALGGGHEFVVRLPRPARELYAYAHDRGLLAGIPLDGVAGCGANDLLVAVTEKRTAADIERFGQVLETFVGAREEVPA